MNEWNKTEDDGKQVKNPMFAFGYYYDEPRTNWETQHSVCDDCEHYIYGTQTGNKIVYPTILGFHIDMNKYVLDFQGKYIVFANKEQVLPYI